MKTFKTFRKKSTPKMIGWDSSFAELRAKGTALLFKEAAAVNTDINSSIEKHIQNDIHIAPGVGLTGQLEKKHADAITKYSNEGRNGSAFLLNSYLRNRSGDKEEQIYNYKSHPSVKKAVETLSSAFTKENTNKKPIVTFGGIPSHIGEHFLKHEKGSQHVLAGFTSTSADPVIAHRFAKTYWTPQPKDLHIARYHVHPGAGLSTHFEGNAHEPRTNPEEKEIILNHGAHVTYHGSEKVDNYRGKPTFIHHLEVHSHRTELHDYPTQYTHD